MKKNGFTLVELLAVIAILGLILTITIPNVMKIITDKKQQLYDDNIKEIERLAQNYMVDYPETYSMFENNEVKIGLTTLCSNGYIECPVKDPRTDTNINGYVKITLLNGDYIYEFIRNLKYTVRRSLTSTGTAWEKVDDNKGLEANAVTNTNSGSNDYDSLYPWSDIISYNYNTTTGAITAYYGDSDFKFDGTNGEVLTRIPEFYYRRYQEDGYEYISISPIEEEGYTRSPEFSVGRYDSSYDTSIHSISNTLPEVERNITSFRTLSQALGSNFGQMDYHYFLLQMLYLVEYADYNSQSVLGSGHTGYRYNADDKALIAEENTNRIVISTNNFVVDQYINIGTAVGNTSIAKYRKITDIEAYDEEDITGYEITFDGNPVNIAVDNVVYSSAQMSGDCDSLGMKSGTVNNDGKHGVIYRGIENIFGNVWQFVDGINIQDNVAYINYNPSTYAVDTFTGDYIQIGYTDSSSGGYITALGYDSNNPLVAFPTSVGGSNSTYISDSYYQTIGNGNALIGGLMYDGKLAGFWYWSLGLTSSTANFSIGSRLLKY